MADMKPTTQQILNVLSLGGGGVTLVLSQNLIAAALIGSLGALDMYKAWSAANLARRQELAKTALKHSVAEGKISADDANKILKEMP